MTRAEMRAKVDGLTDAQVYVFAADCIDRVASSYAAVRPGKKEVAQMISALRDHAAGTSTAAELAAKCEAAQAEALATDDAVSEVKDQAAVFALNACRVIFLYESSATRTDRVEAMLRNCARSYACDSMVGVEPGNTDWELEMTWQMNTLKAM